MSVYLCSFNSEKSTIFLGLLNKLFLSLINFKCQIFENWKKKQPCLHLCVDMCSNNNYTLSIDIQKINTWQYLIESFAYTSRND